MNACQNCKHCGWEPDADYPICYSEKAIEKLNAQLQSPHYSTAFGAYIIRSRPVCEGNFFEQHPHRG